MKNEFYKTNEEYLFAIADAMREEYKAIVDAGFILQIDDPDLADAWQMHPEMSVADYRKYQEMRIDALNHGLRDLPIDRIRFHMCWGSYHGPHKYDIPLKDIADLILKVRADAYSIEASNPCHDHEWRVWEDTKLPDGKILIPMRKSSVGKTSSPALTAASVHAWGIRKSVGQSFRRWLKARASRPRNCGASDPLVIDPTKAVDRVAHNARQLIWL